MRKIITIALREYRAMVGTKAFLLSIIMMPVLMMGSLVGMELLRNSGQINQRKIAVIDHTGDFAEVLKFKADQRNDQMDEAVKALAESGSEGPSNDDFMGFSKEKYIIETVDVETATDDLMVELSQRIRDQDLYAFVEIPKAATDQNSKQKIRFYAQDSSLSEARRWIAQIVNQIVMSDRLKEANIDPLEVQKAAATVNVVGMGLVERSADGSIKSEEEDDPMSAIFLPMGVMLLMFMVIFMAAQPMLESVLEEKSQRIAEVLLGSANPFQLMSGKLMGTVAGSLTVFGIYLIGALGFTFYKGWSDQIPFEIVPWFVVFQVMGVLFYAAIFLAIGASVSQLKEAQAMLLPVWMMMMSPMFVWIFIVRDPLGPMATYFSLFPPAAPTAMMLRMATGQSIPIWQPLLGLLLTAIATLFIVIIASRIFRVGILWQGKTPKIGEILKWAVTG
ncbi:MAG: ABC transporter permease [Mariniblastus sp.]